jgi:Mce-associated membrane protein
VEDQPADSGDLTTDAESPAQSADTAEAADEATDKAARRRHRMPLRKELTASREDTDETATDEATPADEQAEPDVAEVAEAEPAAPCRRWSLFRRRPKNPEPEAVSAPVVDVAEAEEPEPAKPAPRVPTGKASRTAKPVTEPEPPTTDETPVDESVDAESTAIEDTPAEDARPQEEQILVPHRPAGKRLIIAAAAAGVVFVGAAAFAGATVQPYLADRALVHTKLDIARTAANAITTLWSYTPDDMDKLPDRAAGYLAGDFANEYRKYIDAIVAPNKQAQVTNTTQVMGTAVETVTPTEATALVYTNSVATSPVSKNIPSLRYLSYRLTMQRHDAKWLITRMSTVTSFDLTPQL